MDLKGCNPATVNYLVSLFTNKTSNTTLSYACLSHWRVSEITQVQNMTFTETNGNHSYLL